MKDWWKEWLEVYPNEPEIMAWVDSLSKPQRLTILWMSAEVRDCERRTHRDAVIRAFDNWCQENGYPTDTRRPFWAINPDSIPAGMGRAYRRLYERWHKGRDSQ